MNKLLLFNQLQTGRTAGKLGLCAALVVGAAIGAQAQGGAGEIASGTVSGSGSGPYTYNLTFSDDPTATQPIGSVWYSWVPGQFFLPSDPLTAFAPNGWTANLSGTFNSVQFLANSSANYIQPGQTLSGFGYTANFTPAQLAGAANSGESVAYVAGLFSDPPFGSGNTFVVQTAPEPSSLALLGIGIAGFLGITQRKKRA